MAKPSCAHEEGTHCIHASERRSFRACRRRWDWAYRDHLVPFGQAKPLEFGIAIHKGMEVFFNPDTWGKQNIEWKLKKALEAFDEVNQKQREKFMTKNGPGEDDYEERMQLGAGMLTYYAREVHPYADNWIEPVATEVSFHTPLTIPELPWTEAAGTVGDPVTCSNSPFCGQEHPNPAPCTLDGRIDAIFKDLTYGGYYIFDWKSATTLIGDDRFLQIDTQITDYVAALKLQLQINIKGFIYAELRKAFPESPKMLQRRYGGKLYSTSKQQPTTYAMAEQSFKVYDAQAYDAGLYNDYLEFLKESPDKPKFHQRFAIRQPDAKLRNCLDNAAMEAMDMVNPNLMIYPSTGKFNCSTCAYLDPCVGKFLDEDYDYTIESMFEVDTEKRG